MSAPRDDRIERIYDDLRRLAEARLRREQAGHALGATDLVHEVFLRLPAPDRSDWAGTTHYRAVAARAMMQVLVDHARARRAGKRGGHHDRVPLEEAMGLLALPSECADSVEVTEALQRLAGHSERAARVVELRFFGGLTNAEVADELGVSVGTVEGDWRLARAWLRRELGGQ